MANFRFKILLFVVIHSICLHANAALYSDCIYSWEFGNDNRKLVVVRPVGQICYKRCVNECNSFARGDNDADIRKDTDAYNSAVNSVGEELNQDIIDACTLACRKGEYFTSKYRDYDKNHNIVWKDEITTKVACGTSGISSADYNYYQSDLIVDPTKNQKIRIKMIDESGRSEIGSSIYLCGFKTVKLKPVWDSILKSHWPDDATIKSRRSNNKSDWHAKNYNWVDTGIDIKDGDYLEIRYSGNYIFQPDITRYNSPLNKSLQIWKPGPYGATFYSNWTAEELIGSKFILPEVVITGRDKDGVPISMNFSQVENANNSNNNLDWYGLKGKIWSQSRKLPDGYDIFTFNREFGNMLGTNIFSYITDPTESDDLAKRKKERYTIISFSGVLKGFSSQYMRLALRHYDTPNIPGTPPITKFSDNLGGKEVTIKWRGCNFRSGDRLQYAIVPLSNSGEYSPDDPSVEWHDVNIKNDFIPSQGKAQGNIFFRIKKLDSSYNSGLEPSCSAFAPAPCDSTFANINDPGKYAAYNSTGEYYLAVEKESDEAPVSGFLSSILKEIMDYLFNVDPTKPRNGVVPKIFKNLVVDTQFMTAVKALLVFYVAFTGISFITGLAQLNQKEAITRILKISVVTMLISDRSWEIFNTYLFNFFTVGSLELIAKISSSMNGSMIFSNQEFLNNPAIVFNIFDEPFKQLFSSQVWAKIASLVFANLLGFLVAIVVIFAIVIYAICIAKVLMLYLISVISLGILFLVGPVFICFILFNFTKPFFDAWLKQMLSFALQPVFVVTAVAFLNSLLMTALYLTLGFTACKICVFGFSMIGIDICFIPGYISLSSAHHPPADSFGLPMNLLASAILFLIIGQAMYVFCNFAAALGNMIATSSFVGINLAESAAKANPIIGALSFFGSSGSGFYGINRSSNSSKNKRDKTTEMKRAGLDQRTSESNKNDSRRDEGRRGEGEARQENNTEE